MKRIHVWFSLLFISSFLLLTPEEAYSQIDKNIAKRRADVGRVHFNDSTRFDFGPGKMNTLDISVAPKPGLYTLKISWTGTSSSLKASLLHLRSDWGSQIS